VTKQNVIHELKNHRLIMTLLRIIKNTRSSQCEHCEVLLKDVYKCMDDELQDIRNRGNDE
jgi:hypothetical protein